jgi:hypothetical protein
LEFGPSLQSVSNLKTESDPENGKESRLFKNKLYFRAVLGSQQNSGKYREFPYICCLHICTGSPIMNITHQNGTFIITKYPRLTHHHHPKSTVYMRLILSVVQII